MDPDGFWNVVCVWPELHYISIWFGRPKVKTFLHKLGKNSAFGHFQLFVHFSMPNFTQLPEPFLLAQTISSELLGFGF